MGHEAGRCHVLAGVSIESKKVAVMHNWFIVQFVWGGYYECDRCHHRAHDEDQLYTVCLSK